MRLPDLVLLEVDGTPYGVAEVIAAAALRGELTPAITELRRREAARASVDTAALQQAMNAFRVARRLTAADDFKAWLASRSLTLNDVADHLERALCEPAEAEVDAREALYPELVCAGTFDRWMVALGQRLAVYADGGEGAGADLVPDADIEGLGVDPTVLERLVAAESVYRARERSMLDEPKLARRLESQRLELVAFDLEVLEVEDADVARELVQCLRTDGMSVDDAARLAGLEVARPRAFAQDLPRSIQRELLAAVPGEVLGPFRQDHGHRVIRMVRKTLPTLGNARVRGLLEDQLRRGAFDDALGRWVRFRAWRPRG